MSDQENISIVQKAVVLLGGVIAPIFMLYTMTKSPDAPVKPDTSVKVDAEFNAAVEERIKPLAVVEVAAESGLEVERSGEEVVKIACAACHATGLMSAPKIGDNAGWTARIALGFETLISNAINGIRTMPARGGNPDLSDDEVARAVAYMANQSGANFTAPEVTTPEISTPAE